MISEIFPSANGGNRISLARGLFRQELRSGLRSSVSVVVRRAADLVAPYLACSVLRWYIPAAVGIPGHNPLIEKRKAAAETLNRKRRTASETSVKIAEETSAFFDRLALLNGGALTFSVTLLSHPTESRSQLFILYAAWILLLVALAACLARNYSNMGHRFYGAASNRVESELALIDADSQVMEAMSNSLVYEDAAEPFDKERELRINRENREVWQKELERTKKQAGIRWKLSEIAEWTAGVSMCLGFLLLIVFAICNNQMPARFQLR